MLFRSKAFISVDLPALGLPIKFTKPALCVDFFSPSTDFSCILLVKLVIFALPKGKTFRVRGGAVGSSLGS